MKQETADAFLTQWFEPFDHDIKKTLEGMALIDLGTMKQVHENGTCDVVSYAMSCGKRVEYKNIEIILPAGMGCISPGGQCLVLRPVVNMVSIKNMVIDAASSAYNATGAKCIPIAPIKKTDVHTGIDLNGNFVVEGSGISFNITDSQIKISYGGNEYIWNNDGTTSSTSSGGIIDTGSDDGNLVYNIYKEVEEGEESPLIFSFLLDLTGGIYVTSTQESTKTAQINIGNNIIRVNDNENDTGDVNDGKHIYLEDANRDPEDEDSHGNKIVLNEDGIDILDINENHISLTEVGTTITCTNGNVITLDEHGVDITDVNGHKLTLSDASDGIAAVVSDSSTISIKNSANSLGELLQELGQYLISAATVGSPGAHTMDPTTQSNFQLWMQDVQKVFS